MKKVLKIIGIILASLAGLLIVTILVIGWLVLTPERLTPIAKKQAEKYISCSTSLDKVDISLFKTFPNVGLKINNLLLVNPVEGQVSDTLLYIDECIVALNIKELIKNNSIIVNEFYLKNGFANLFVDSLGNANYDVFISDTTSSDDNDDSSFNIDKIDLEKLTLENIKANYTNLASNICAETDNLDLVAKGGMKGEDILGNIHLKTGNTLFSLNDSIQAGTDNLDLVVKGEKKGKDASGNMHLKAGNTMFSINDSIIHAGTDNLDLIAKGGMKGDVVSGNLQLKIGSTLFSLNDSLSVAVSTDGITTTFNGNITDFNAIKGDLDLALSDISLKMGNIQYLQPAQLIFDFPLDLVIDKQYLALNKASLSINEQHILKLNGNVSNDTINGDISMDMAFETNHWDIKETLELVPDPFKYILDGIDIAGGLSLSGKAVGIYNDSSMPVITANALYDNGELSIAEVPYTFSDINVDLGANINLNANSRLNINSLRGKTENSSVECSGTIDDLFNKMLCNLKLNADVNLPDIQPVIPPDIKLKGLAKASLNAKFTMDHITQMALDQMNVAGTINLTDLDVVYNDSIMLKSSSTNIDVELPSLTKNQSYKELLSAKIESNEIDAVMVDFLSADVQNVKLNIGVSDFMDTTAPLWASGNFDFNNLKAEIDTISVDISNPSGSFSLNLDEKTSQLSGITFAYKNNSLSAKMGGDIALETKTISLNGSMEHNSGHDDFILQWNPQLNVDFQQGVLEVLSNLVKIPAIQFDFTPERIDIKDSRIIWGNSEFELSGIITNLDDYLNKTGLLTGDLNFVSENTDVYQLMDYVNGFGSQTDTVSAPVELENAEDNPFMVPLGIDITLNTKVKRAFVGKTLLENLHGKLTIKDGILVLEEMGFTSDAARMQITAMYRSPRKNHLYAGVDFHLLDIDIARLLEMIPDIDTIVPMLKSFSGKAEFHFSIETYLKSNYELKFSTLRGAAAINGQDLTLSDMTVLPKISRKLLFKKQTEAKVDSLSVEMTIYRNEIDLYPFLISLGKYKAVISGRHNLDMTYNYHISITDTPLPIRFGLNIISSPKRTKFPLTRCKYARLYRPGKQNAVDKKTLELKQLISNSLKSGVKE
jgi:hypothetical protein